jgi:hypothetical protein
VRHCGAAKQRVWLGAGRYRGGCRDAVANCDADSHANTNRDPSCVRADDADTYGHADGNSNSDGNGYTDADVDTYTEACSNTEASAHAATSTVEIFAGANIPSDR